MDDYTTFLTIAYTLVSYLLVKRRAARRIWARRIFLERPLYSHGANLLPTMMNENPDLFFNFTRMSGAQFEFLLSMVGSRLEKQTTHIRTPIPPFQRLAICLRFLATGSSYAELSYGFRVGKSTVCGIVKETCQALIQVLQPRYMKLPESHNEWREIAAGFEYKWQFPNCVGAIDGKHVAIQAPPSAGSSFINYKGFHSIVLLATCDAQYCFTFVDIGNYGRVSDGGVFGRSFIARKLRTDPAFLPPNSLLNSSDKIVPYVFVGDEAFPLQKHLLRPFPGHFLETEKRIFNYRLSRARRCIENAFGILVSRWRVLRTTMALSPDNASLVTMACCCLHNFLMKYEMPYAEKTYCPLSFSDRAMENGLISDGEIRVEDPLPSISQQTIEEQCNLSDARDIFKEYFNNEGSVSWQGNV